MKNFTEQEILDFAEEEVSGRYISTAYPIIPVDDSGNPERYDIGCCRWMSCDEFTVISSMMEEEQEEEDRFDVVITCNWKWHGEEEEKGVELYVPIYVTDEGLEVGEDIERID